MVRVDEITILPRDNSLLVATHGRALGILDHLEPIQEYSAARASANDAHVFLPPTALQRKAKDDRDDEVLGHYFFAGENQPVDARRCRQQLRKQRRVSEGERDGAGAEENRIDMNVPK